MGRIEYVIGVNCPKHNYCVALSQVDADLSTAAQVANVRRSAYYHLY